MGRENVECIHHAQNRAYLLVPGDNDEEISGSIKQE